MSCICYLRNFEHSIYSIILIFLNTDKYIFITIIICQFQVQTTKALLGSFICTISEKPFKYEDDELRSKPPVPARTEKPLMGLHTNKNFIKTNAVENIMAVPKKVLPAYADTKKGDKQPLENSGLIPKFIKKKVRRVM